MVKFLFVGYQPALDKAWGDLALFAKAKRFSVKLLSDLYDVDLDSRTILSASCNAPAKDYAAILILHYLTRKLALGVLPDPSGEWIDFNQLEGGEAYYPAFKKRTIDRVINKYGGAPEKLLEATGRMPAKAAKFADAAIIVYPVPETGMLIKISKSDEEFGPDAAILFDKNISSIFCTEDIVVLTEMIVHQL